MEVECAGVIECVDREEGHWPDEEVLDHCVPGECLVLQKLVMAVGDVVKL